MKISVNERMSKQVVYKDYDCNLWFLNGVNPDGNVEIQGYKYNGYNGGPIKIITKDEFLKFEVKIVNLVNNSEENDYE